MEIRLKEAGLDVLIQFLDDWGVQDLEEGPSHMHLLGCPKVFEQQTNKKNFWSLGTLHAPKRCSGMVVDIQSLHSTSKNLVAGIERKKKNSCVFFVKRGWPISSLLCLQMMFYGFSFKIASTPWQFIQELQLIEESDLEDVGVKLVPRRKFLKLRESLDRFFLMKRK